MFEDDVCANPLDASYGRPTYANISSSEVFVGPCVDRLEVVDEGPDYATAPVF